MEAISELINHAMNIADKLKQHSIRTHTDFRASVLAISIPVPITNAAAVATFIRKNVHIACQPCPVQFGFGEQAT